jgi:IS30 family transposase
MTLLDTYTNRHENLVSNENIYNCICTQLVGELKHDLIKLMRHSHKKRVPRCKGLDRRGRIREMVSIHVHTPEIEVRQFPDHWYGYQIKGKANGIGLSALVE